jgi:hypothetical protein
LVLVTSQDCGDGALDLVLLFQLEIVDHFRHPGYSFGHFPGCSPLFLR